MKTVKKKTTGKSRKKHSELSKLPKQILLGDLFTSRFFNRHKFSILVIVALILFYITIKYECRTRMETIAKLQTELAIVKSESIRERSTFCSRTRESAMTQLVDSMHLRLSIQDEPPTVLKYDKQ